MPFVNPITTGRGINLTAAAQARHAHDDEQHARHYRAQEESVDPMHRDNARHDNHESAGRPANLRLRAAQPRNQESGNDRAVNPRLWRQPRSNRKCHRKRQGHQTHRNSRNQIKQEFVPVVIRVRQSTDFGSQSIIR